MPAYSLAGYLAALTMRTNQTLIVEGKHDLEVVARLVVELTSASPGAKARRLLIDTAEIIQAVPGVFSNREKVEVTYNLTKGSGRIGAFVDREFRGFTTFPAIADSLSAHHTDGTGLFWTRGHSVENYFLKPEDAIAFVAMFYPEHMPDEFGAMMISRMDYVLRVSAAVTKAAAQHELLKKCDGFWDVSHWSTTREGAVGINLGEITNCLARRGVDAPTLVGFTATLQDGLVATSGLDVQVCRWFSHGHLGHQLFWSAAGRVMADCGVDATVASNVARGFLAQKLRISADIWSKECAANEAECPAEFISWLKTKLAA